MAGDGSVLPVNSTGPGRHPELHPQWLVCPVTWTKILFMQEKHEARGGDCWTASAENWFGSLVSCLCCFVWISFSPLVRVFGAIFPPVKPLLTCGSRKAFTNRCVSLSGSGANVNAAKLHETALHHAAKVKNVDLVEMLIEFGGNIYARDNRGKKPSDYTWSSSPTAKCFEFYESK